MTTVPGAHDDAGVLQPAGRGGRQAPNRPGPAPQQAPPSLQASISKALDNFVTSEPTNDYNKKAIGFHSGASLY